MSIAKVNHSVWHAYVDQTIAVDTDNTESEWWDTNGWTDKVITVELDPAAGSPDVNVDILVSPKGYYELNNAASTSTEDYVKLSIVANLAVGTLTRYDSSDVDDLQRPIRSMAVVVDNNDGVDAVSVNVWVEGWS